MTAEKRPVVIKINAITVPEDSGDELARRFAARAGAVDNQDGRRSPAVARGHPLA
jgi:heme-degrading monooxygenase HmoA